MSKLGKEGHKCHFLNCLKLEKDKRAIGIVFFKLDQREKRGKESEDAVAMEF